MEAYYSDDDVQLYLDQDSGCLGVLPSLPDASVEAICTDPPYELAFMGRAWDATGIAYNVDVWRECLRVLKPGGHLLAFGGTRTYHRMTCAIEDAGFEIRDSLHWLYGSGFPKSLDVSKAIDKAGGASPQEQAAVLRVARERAELSREQVAAVVGCTASSVRDWEEGRCRAAGAPVEYLVPSPQYRAKLADLLGYTQDERVVVGVGGGSRGLYETGHRGIAYGAPATADAERWAGWGTALKPAHEPIVLARKPLAGTVAGTVLEHGTGALNIDACRVASPAPEVNARTNKGGSLGYHGGAPQDQGWNGAAGRWPTNVLLSHAPLLDDDGQPVGDACADGCVPGCPVAELDRQSGVLRTGSTNRGAGLTGAVYGDGNPDWAPERGYTDSGGASRFFPTFRYEAKAPARERPRLPDGTAHPTVKPLALMRWLVRLVTPPGGTVLDPFAGTGTTLEACFIEGFRATGVEIDRANADLCRTRLDKPIAATFPGLDP